MVDTISLTGSHSILWSPTEPAKDEDIARTMRLWMNMARDYHASLDEGLVGAEFDDAFHKVMISDRVRDSQHKVVRSANEEDLRRISWFIAMAQRSVGHHDRWDKYVCNQTFLVTKTGTMGLGHLESQPGDQAWVVDGGKMPFTVRPWEATKNDYDFVGCCFAQGCMEG